jgi:hypothetical protein
MPLREVVDHLAFLEHVGIINLKEDLYELNTKSWKTWRARSYAKKGPNISLRLIWTKSLVRSWSPA